MTDKKQVSYKDKREELDKAIARLQSDDLDVDEALILYKKSQDLIKELEDYLAQAENTINKYKTKLED
jgi:exodeoxyribonuclease VII small subunit